MPGWLYFCCCKGAYPPFTRDWCLLDTDVYSKYSNERDDHTVAVLKDGETVNHLPNLVRFCGFFASYSQFHSVQASSFLFMATPLVNPMCIYQTVLQLPPLTSFQPPTQHCYSVCFSLCHHSRWDYCHVDIMSSPQAYIRDPVFSWNNVGLPPGAY